MQYVKHPKKSVGNIIHFINYICGLHVAEKIQIGPNVVTHCGKVLATYTYDSEDFPVFDFEDNIYGLRWVEKKRNEAIKDWEDYKKLHNL